jgi:hypothetical protein
MTALGLLVALAAQPDRDAVRAVEDARRALQRDRSFRVALAVVAGDQTDEYTGASDGRVANLEGPFELFVSGASAAVKRDEEWVRPQDLAGADRARCAAVRDPNVVLAEFFSTARTARSEDSETLRIGEEDVECRVARTTADERLTESQVRELLSRIPSGGMFDVSAIVDVRGSRSEYRAWIERESGRLRRLEWTLVPRVDRDRLPQGVPLPPGAEGMFDRLRAEYRLTLDQFGGFERIEVPRAAARWLR